MSECYELSLTPNYVSDWTFNDALRELIQNGIDQETIRPDNKFSIDYDEGKEVIRLVNKNAKLKISTLLLGKTNKSNDEDTVGQFGEGYKIAALVLNRLGKTFTIYNNEKKEIWTSRFKNSAKWGSEILAFYIEKQPDADEKNLVIEIGHVKKADSMIVLRNENISAGMEREIKYAANHLGIPVRMVRGREER